MFALIDNTADRRWDGYKTEGQLKTATRLYAMQHPRNSISVVIGGATHKVR